MSEKPENETQSFKKSLAEEASNEKPYLYKEAGITERQGKIPLWLKLVAIGLIVWGVYYTITYWSAG
ncbi:MAG: hypothetical protein ACYDBV_09670 [Nitrospiria bacterium]